jgi:mannose/cellobiose epimerase-like protein (N-acyl-D-glucosamine 2-epimerase family)
LIDDFLDAACEIASVVVTEDLSGTTAAAQGRLSEEQQETAWFLEYTARLADKGLGIKNKSKAPFTAMLRSKAAPRPVTAALLVDRAYKAVPSLAVAQRLVQALMENKVVDEQGMLLGDPRTDVVNWRDTVYRTIPDVRRPCVRACVVRC